MKAVLTFRTIDNNGLTEATQTFVITDKQPLIVRSDLKVAGMTIELERVEDSHE